MQQRRLYGIVHTWGCGEHGQLGTGATPRAEPRPQAVPLPSPCVSVASGGSHVVAVDAAGEVWLWGGQRGPLRPRAVAQLRQRARSVACGALTTAAATVDGRVYEWAVDAFGALVPEASQPLEGKERPVFEWVACGALHSLARDSKGRLWAWGEGSKGQIGHRAAEDAPVPVQLPLDNVVSASGGAKHSAAVSCGRLYTWGLAGPRLGLEGWLAAQNYRPDVVASPHALWLGSDVVVASVACGDEHTLCVTVGGDVWAFGANGTGQLGLGDRVDRGRPERVAGLSLVAKVAAGGGFHVAHSAALTLSGALLAWGSNRYGQLGSGQPADYAVCASPARVEFCGGSVRVCDVACGWLSTACVVEGSAPGQAAPDPGTSLGLFSVLPNDVIALVLSLLDPISLSRVCAANRSLHYFAGSEELWHRAFETAVAEFARMPRWREQALVGRARALALEATRPWRPRVVALLQDVAATDLSSIGSRTFAPTPAQKRGLVSRLVGLVWKGGKRTGLFGGMAARLVMLGLDAAGKTTIMYKLRLGEVETSIPTIGFNIETVARNKTTMVNWDVGGEDKIRPLWRHYFQGAQTAHRPRVHSSNERPPADVGGLIWVVDCCDRDRMDEVLDELHRLLNEPQVLCVPLLVYANKQDLPNAMSAPELAERLQLRTAATDRHWWVQACCATEGSGLAEGLDWLGQAIESDEPLLARSTDSILELKCVSYPIVQFPFPYYIKLRGIAMLLDTPK
eukprot:m51a1_g9136 putative adp-ribosylation factor 1 (739) ;mRNA; f:57203-59766